MEKMGYFLVRESPHTPTQSGGFFSFSNLIISVSWLLKKRRTQRPDATLVLQYRPL